MRPRPNATAAAVSTTTWSSEVERVPGSPWVAVAIGLLLGAVAGTILAAFWLTFALGFDPDTFDALLLWTGLAGASAVLSLHRPATDYGRCAGRAARR